MDLLSLVRELYFFGVEVKAETYRVGDPTHRVWVLEVDPENRDIVADSGVEVIDEPGLLREVADHPLYPPPRLDSEGPSRKWVIVDRDAAMALLKAYDDQGGTE